MIEYTQRNCLFYYVQEKKIVFIYSLSNIIDLFFFFLKNFDIFHARELIVNLSLIHAC